MVPTMNTRTATTLFIDPTGNPTDVPDATADVFYFSNANAGVRVWVLPQGFPMTKVVGETGRYAVSFTQPTGVRTVYATMYGTDPGSGVRIVSEQQVLIW
jgi:hypothetical protein